MQRNRRHNRLFKPVQPVKLEPLPCSAMLWVYRLTDQDRKKLKVDKDNPGIVAVIA